MYYAVERCKIIFKLERYDQKTEEKRAVLFTFGQEVEKSSCTALFQVTLTYCELAFGFSSSGLKQEKMSAWSQTVHLELDIGNAVMET